MAKRGPKPKKIIDTKWSPYLAYAIGLIAADGYLAKNSYLIDLTSNDRDQLENYRRCLNIDVLIGKKSSGNGRISFRVQLKNLLFYNFLLKVGLSNAKSKTLGPLKIPRKYFYDFLRGIFDGDGCTYSYWDKRWKSSFMFYLSFASASPKFIEWLQASLFTLSKVKGHVTRAGGESTYYQLKYAKAEGAKILRKMYYNKDVICLERKRLKINKMLDIVGQQLPV